MPISPPIDHDPDLSVKDVAACVWYVWQVWFKREAAYPTPANLITEKINTSFPGLPWGTSHDPNGVAKKFLKDIQTTLVTYTGYRANVGFQSFEKAHKSQNWGEFCALLHAKAIYAANLKRAGLHERVGPPADEN